MCGHDIDISNAIKKLSVEIRNVCAISDVHVPVKAGKVLGTVPSSDGDLIVLKKIKSFQEKESSGAYLDLVFFLLNAIAFYGYMICVFAYFLPEERSSLFTTGIMLGLRNSDADFYGILVGDVAWTVEPMIVILLPLYKILFISDKVPVKQKKKSD